MVYKMQNGFPLHREPLSYLVAEDTAGKWRVTFVCEKKIAEE
jgi:hypothetical protein